MLKKIKKLLKGSQAKTASDPQTDLRTRYPDFEESVLDVLATVTPFTMTSPERIEALCSAVDHIAQHQLPGDIVECGVWRGGSMMAVAQRLLAMKDANRTLHLYDTFEGMPPAKDIDRDFLDADANLLLEQQDKTDPQSIHCYSGLEEVRQNMSSTGYPPAQLRFVKGKVEDTLVADLPDDIALLRLDTDWYESTRVCLEQLYPKLRPGGVLIIDDYGHWQGCRKAVDEYFEKNSIPILLTRIDYTGRIAIKPSEPFSVEQRQSA